MSPTDLARENEGNRRMAKGLLGEKWGMLSYYVFFVSPKASGLNIALLVLPSDNT
jgi:hypothetical protein